MPDSKLRRTMSFALPMKRLGLTLGLTPAMLFLSTVLRAEAPKPAENPAGGNVTVQRAAETTAPLGRPTAEEILKRFDKNGDGKLDADETADAHDAVMQEEMQRREERQEAGKKGAPPERVLQQFDRNHDGKLDDEERAEMKKFAAEHGFAGPGNLSREELLKRFDKNGDGTLDEDERAEMRKAIAARGGGSPMMAMRQELVRRFDTNRDGTIDDAEWAALSPLLRERLSATLRQLHRYDKNGDGTIDEAEWADATQEIRHWLDEGPRKREPRPPRKNAPNDPPAPAKAREAGAE